MLSYGTYAAILFGSITLIILLGAIILLRLSLPRLVALVEKMFHFKPIRSIGDDYVMLDVCDDKFELIDTLSSRLPFASAVGMCLLVSILVFIEGCIFSTRHVYSTRMCSTRTPNCYLFSTDLSLFKPLYNFVCEPDAPVIPSNMSASYAVCYGFVLPDQSSIDILNQLGVCTAIQELVRALYPQAYKFARGRVGLVSLAVLLCLLITLEVIVLSIQINISFITVVLFMLVDVLLINIFVLHYRRVKGPATVERVGSYVPIDDVN